ARLVLSVLLKTQGQEVHEAETGTAALDEMETFRPEIVFCDIGLPDMEGYAVATAIRLNPALKGVYLVALTGSGGAEDKEKALAAGFDRHMTKPISYDQLRGILLGDSVGSSS
ncbi:MAG: response regulator, partial [Pirellulales bacterium]